MSKNIFIKPLIILLTLLNINCYSQKENKDVSLPVSELINVENDIKLEVVNWGGEGKAIVLLAGLGHTAHVFDDFAPLFTENFKVLGITRRGFGASSIPDTGYTLTRLANDIRIVLDSLKINKAIFIGHSLGGDEITKFANLYPDRIELLIYLEAAYDRVSMRDTLAEYPEPEYDSPAPTDDDLASVEAFMDFYEKANGVRWPESELRTLVNLGPDGKILNFTTPSSVFAMIHGALEHPDYTMINAPSLAIYAVGYPITEIYTEYNLVDSSTQESMSAKFDVIKRMNELSRIQFQNDMKNGKVMELSDVGHSLYLTHPQKVSREILNFLK